MLTKTLQAGLERHEIGAKLRRLRLKKKMGLVELGQHTGLSAAMLSKLERGRLVPTLPTLLRIALVFDVGLDHFFAEDAQRRVLSITRREERQKFPERPDGGPVSYHFESLDFTATGRRLSAYRAEFEPLPRGGARPHNHDGVEFLYVLGGRLELEIGGRTVVLRRGDAAYLDATVPHSYRRVSRKPCSALAIIVS